MPSHLASARGVIYFSLVHIKIPGFQNTMKRFDLILVYVVTMASARPRCFTFRRHANEDKITTRGYPAILNPPTVRRSACMLGCQARLLTPKLTIQPRGHPSPLKRAERHPRGGACSCSWVDSAKR